MDIKKSLFDQIIGCQENYKTDSYTMTIGELMNMYSNKELVVNPIYQREFRWSAEQKSKFIESILLELPLPSIFIFQDRKFWEVIDGLQRLSTIMQFVGLLKDGNFEFIKTFKIDNVKKIQAINGLGWDDFDEDTQFAFRKIKIDIKIIKDSSKEKSKAKFELFQRLNQRPSVLSGQEYRNALLIMYDEKIYNWLKKLSDDENFKICISGLEDRWIKEQYDKELILRLFVFPLYALKSKYKKIDDYLDNSIFYDENSLISKIADNSFDLDLQGKCFKKTFQLLSLAKGPNIFKSINTLKGQQFLESLFEAIAIGLYFNIEQYNENDISYLIGKIDNLDNEEDFRNAKGTGTNTEIRIRKLVPFSKNYFKKDEQEESISY